MRIPVGTLPVAARTAALLISGALPVIQTFLVALAAVTVLLYAGDRLTAVTRTLAWELDAKVIALLALIVLFAAALQRQQKVGIARLVFTSCFVVLGFGAWKTANVDPEWVSDFNTMWLRASQSVGQHFAVAGIHDQRIVLLLVPAVKLLGAHTWVVSVVNFVAASVALLLMGTLARDAGGESARATFGMLFVLSPEILLALGIPTHDLWALPFIAIAAVTIARAFGAGLAGDRRRALLWSALGSIALVLLQIQREIGHVGYVAAGLGFLTVGAACLRSYLSDARSNADTAAARTILLCALLFGALYPIGLGTAKSVGLIANDEWTQRLANVRSGGIFPSFSRGTYADAKAFGDHFLDKVPATEQVDFAADVVLSDSVAQPGRRVPNALHRLHSLARLGNQTYFYWPGVEQTRPEVASRINAATAWYAVFFGVLLLIASMRAWRHGMVVEMMFPVIFMCVLIAALALVGETQPRYLIPLWLLGAFFIGVTVFGRPQQEVMRIEQPLRGAVLALALAALAGLVAWRVAGSTYVLQDGRVITDWDIVYRTTKGTQEEAEMTNAPFRGAAFGQLMGDDRFSAIGKLGVTLRLPFVLDEAATARAHTTICGNSGGNFTFFYYMPYTGVPEAFELGFDVDGTTLWSVDLPGAPGVHYISLPMSLEGCRPVTFTLRHHAPLQDSSWTNASQVEIYFPRYLPRAQ